MMSKYKPVEKIIAATPVEKTYHQQSLTRGVFPVLTDFSSDWDALMVDAAREAEKYGFVEKGDTVVSAQECRCRYQARQILHGKGDR